MKKFYIILFTLLFAIIFFKSNAHAANIDLRITKDGSVLQGNTSAGETYFGWRENIMFASLSSQYKEGPEFFTVNIVSDIGKLDEINPTLYAVHGAGSVLIFSSPEIRTWSVQAPAGSQVTVVANVPYGVFIAPWRWRLVALLGIISDIGWITIAFALPLFTLLLYWLKTRAPKPREGQTNTLNNEILRASPAAITVLWRGFVSRRATVATLFDLARRGHIQILVNNRSTILYLKQGRDSIRPHEKMLIDRWLSSKTSSNLNSLQSEIKNELINQRSTEVNLAIYDEVAEYGWFKPSPLLTHWKIMIASFLLTVIISLFFIAVFVFLPSATALLWFSLGCFFCIAILYAWTPRYVKRSAEGNIAFTDISSVRSVLASKTQVHPSLTDFNSWEEWLAVSITLGVTNQWLERWKDVPFQQPGWLITEDPVRSFEDLITKLTPVLSVTSESIKDKILPAYI